MNIDQLVQEMTPVVPMKAPSWFVLRLAGVLLAYFGLCLAMLGLRDDWMAQLSHLEFTAELVLLLLIGISSVQAAVHLAWPDAYQRIPLLKLPFYVAGAFVLLMLSAVLMPLPVIAALPTLPDGGEFLGCTLCMGAMSVVPTVLIFGVIRKGASVRPTLAGLYSVLAATSMSCFVLRLEEKTDDLPHLIFWHYLPMLAFSLIGLWMGKKILRW